MFTAAHMKKLRHSAGQWSSDLSSVPQVTSDVIDNPFGEWHCQLLKGWMFKEERLSQKCQHNAALLFAIRGIQTPSCTSTPCKWMAPTQVSPDQQAVQICPVHTGVVGLLHSNLLLCSVWSSVQQLT
ncbi:hypothetical protein MRX96_021036 [Rhipicephalus microplus]